MRKRLALFLCMLALSGLAVPACAQEYTALVRGGALHLRAQADQDAKSLGRYRTGTRVSVLADGEIFCRVRTPDGREGYMMKEYLEFENGLPPREVITPSPAPTPDLTRQNALARGIDPNKPMLALTFDDGPAFDGSTGRILDVLEKYGARATFFMVGTRINDNTKKYLKRELELGCELGNHTYNHDHYGKTVTEADVVKCSDAVYKACGKRPTAFRCPGGNMSSVMQNTAKKEGMIIAYWSVDTEDWKSRNPAQIISRAEHGAYDGSIILMHDIYSSTADAVEKIVPALVKKGYQIVTVSEMIQAKTGKAPQAGQQYIDYKTINNNTH